MMGKLIFLDIDGTILPPGQRPSRVTVEAIRATRSNGHKVFLSTGRVETGVADYVRAIGFDGGIYSAGGRAVVNGAEILNRPMPIELVQQIIDIMESGEFVYMLEAADGIYIVKDGTLSSIDMEQFDVIREFYRLLEERQHSQKPKWAAELRKHPVYKIDFLTESKAQADLLGEQIGPTAKVVRFDVLASEMPLTFGEISDWGINKGVALEYVCRYLDAEPADCIAFGDSMNDAEILQAAGIGVAMANSEAGVMELADQVCESCEENGVAKTLARMGLI